MKSEEENAEEIAAEVLYLRLSPPGGEDDLNGIDGFSPVQIKLDRTASSSRNLIWEIEKRNDGKWNRYGNVGGWRTSPGWVYDHIFVVPDGQGYLIYSVSHSEMLRLVKDLGLSIVEILPTARGYLLPIDRLSNKPIHWGE